MKTFTRLAAAALAAFFTSIVFAQPQTVTTTANQTITGVKTFSGSNKLCLKDPSDADLACIVAQAMSGSKTITLPSVTGTLVTTADIASFGTGDVVGPGSATADHVVLFNGTTGKLIKDGGALATVATSGSASDLGTGTLPAGRLPNPSSSTLGGIQSAASQSNKWIDSISTSGVPSLSQPAFSNLSGSATCAQMPALTSDVTTSAGSCATTIANNAVTLAKMATVSTATILGRTSASTGNVEALTATQATALLNAVVGDSGSGGTKGLVPAPATGDAAAGKFLKADGTFAVPPGTAGSGDFVKIAQVVTSSSAATISFTSIPGTYTNLKIVLQGRDTSTGAGATAPRMKFNSDGTSGNYTSTQYFEAFGGSSALGTDAASSNGMAIGQIPGTSGNSNALGVVECTIPSYAATTFYKMMSCGGGAIYSSSIFEVRIGQWKSTSAITRIDITAGTTAFVDGTTATLYGMN